MFRKHLFTQQLLPEVWALYKQQWLQHASAYPYVVYFDSNAYPSDRYQQYECIIGVARQPFIEPPYTHGATTVFEALRNAQSSPDWLLGFLSYEIKNEVEPKLTSHLPAEIALPTACFIRPEWLIVLNRDGVCRVEAIPDFAAAVQAAMAIPKNSNELINDNLPVLEFQSYLSHFDYIARVERLQQHLHRGDLYEINFCQPYIANNVQLSPLSVFWRLNTYSRAPFAAYIKCVDQYILCASPERYLQKNGDKLIAQPIKGTAPRRLDNPAADLLQQQQLRHSTKEQSENVMIVDLMRNDLSRVAARGSVAVPELFGVYSFAYVHQLISTVSARLDSHFDFADALRCTFPMGSMTGAPKLRAMQLTENYELRQRGVYSGALGYINPQNDFDFNVCIRTLCYDDAARKISLFAGGAITSQANAQAEYEECNLKAESVLRPLSWRLKKK